MYQQYRVVNLRNYPIIDQDNKTIINCVKIKQERKNYQLAYDNLSMRLRDYMLKNNEFYFLRLTNDINNNFSLNTLSNY